MCAKNIYSWICFFISAWCIYSICQLSGCYSAVFNAQINKSDVCVCVCLFFTGVKRACCDFLNSQLDPSNCLGIRDFAETHNCLDLMQAAELFSQKHFAEVVQQEEFMLLSQSEVEKLIKCDEIQVRLSAVTFSALFHFQWVPAFEWVFLVIATVPHIQVGKITRKYSKQKNYIVNSKHKLLHLNSEWQKIILSLIYTWYLNVCQVKLNVKVEWLTLHLYISCSVHLPFKIIEIQPVKLNLQNHSLPFTTDLLSAHWCL